MDGKMDMGKIEEFPVRLSSEVQFIFLLEKLILGRWKQGLKYWYEEFVLSQGRYHVFWKDGVEKGLWGEVA
jgi:hypothetical protein